MFEPKIITDISNLPKNIETNLAELEPIIAEKCELANTLIVSPDSLEECDRADADAAMLTKLGERIKRFRIDWTASWQSPFEGVIAKCKDYERRLAEAAKNLREKSAVGKDKVKAAKRDELYAVWNAKLDEGVSPAMRGAPSFALFFDTMTDAKTKGNWLNKTVKPEAAHTQMDEEIARCKANAATVATMTAGEPTAVRSVAEDALYRHFDVAEVVEAVNQYKEQQKRIAEAEARARQLAEETKAEPPAEARAPAPKAEPPRVLADGGVPLETYRLAVTGTRANLLALRKWGEEHGITFKNIDK